MDGWQRAERAERERDEAVALLRDMKPHWDANTRGRIWDATTAGFMASIRARIDAVLGKDKP